MANTSIIGWADRHWVGSGTQIESNLLGDHLHLLPGARVEEGEDDAPNEAVAVCACVCD